MKNRDLIRVYRKILHRPITITAILLLLTSFLSLQTNEGIVLGKFSGLEIKRISELEVDLSEPLFFTSSISQSLNLSISDKISAKSVIVLDPTTHTTLYDQNSDQQLAPASLTKIATAVVVLQNMDLGQIATVPENISEKAQGSLMGLVPNEKITVENLLWGMLLPSGNDAAHTLAVNFPNGYNAFIDKMNELSAFLQLKNTHFTNPMGFDNDEHFSCAYDLAVLSSYALRNPLFAEIVGTVEKTVVSDLFVNNQQSAISNQPSFAKATEGKQWHELRNTNELLGKIEGVNGIKTGYTKNAGECMAISLKRNGQDIIIIILGSENRLKDAEVLISSFY